MADEKEKEQRAEVNFVAISSDRTRSSVEARSPYSRKFDNQKKREAFKDQTFDDKKTVKDAYSGDILHKDNNAALNKYGKNNQTKHTADVDHTVPLKEVYDRNSKNAFLSDGDIREIANNEKNYKVISSKTNRSKQSKSNIKHIATKRKKGTPLPKEQIRKMQREQLKAETIVTVDAAKRTVQNANSIGTNAAFSAGKLQAGISTAKNLKKIIQNEEDFDTAAKEVIKDTATSMATAYGTSITAHMVEASAKNVLASQSNVFVEKIASNLAKPGGAAKAVTFAIDAGESVIHFLDGEISAEELVLELGQKGTAMATSIMLGSEGAFIGAVAGEAMGAVIGTFVLPGVGTAVCADVCGLIGFFGGELLGTTIGYVMGSEIYARIAQKLNDPKWNPEEKVRLIKMYDRLYVELCEYEKILSSQLDFVNENFENNIRNGFLSMREYILANDYTGINQSLNIICNEFNTSIAYESNADFENFLNDDTFFSIGYKSPN